MKYKCIVPFSISKCDGNGFSIGRLIGAAVGEIFETGNERIVHLNSIATPKWLEISRATLEKYFVEVKE